jgi:hypothetical protein
MKNELKQAEEILILCGFELDTVGEPSKLCQFIVKTASKIHYFNKLSDV